MEILKKLNKKNISLFLCYLTINSYIILGNCLTYNLGNRLPLKVAEMIGIVTVVILFCMHKFKILRVDRRNIKVFIWFVIATIPIFLYNYQISEMAYGMLYTVRILFTFGVVIVITNTLKKYKVSVDSILNMILVSYIAVCAIGILQLILYPSALDFYDLFFELGIYYANGDPHVERIISTYFDPNFLSACLITPMIIAYHYFFTTDKKRYLLAFLFILGVILFTVSRSGTVGAVVAICIYTLLRFRYRKDEKTKKANKKCFIITGIICIIFALLLLFSNLRVFQRIRGTADDDSTYARLDSWNNGIAILQGEEEEQDEEQEEEQEDSNDSNRILGIGFNMIGFMDSKEDEGASTAFGNDSSLILIVITSGVFGTIYFACFIIGSLVYAYKKREENSLYMILITVMVVALMICNFNNLLFYILWVFPTALLYNLLDDNKLEKQQFDRIAKIREKITKK